jgi:hypothetical protein
MTTDFTLSSVDGTVLYGIDSVIQRYENCLMGVPDEFSPSPDFGIGFPIFVGEPLNDKTKQGIKTIIVERTKKFFPEIKIQELSITQSGPQQITIDLIISVLQYGETRQITKKIG